jgi:hypothetical protein
MNARTYTAIYNPEGLSEIRDGRTMRIEGGVISVEMVEFEPHRFVNRTSGERLGLIVRATKAA